MRASHKNVMLSVWACVVAQRVEEMACGTRACNTHVVDSPLAKAPPLATPR